jgi:uncharacterized membrane protein YdjX (TVP38/TMEM64 family)
MTAEPETARAPGDDRGRRRRWTRYLPLALVALALVGAYAAGLHKQLSLEALRSNREALAAFVDARPALAVAAYVLFYLAFTTLMLPGALWLTIAGGLLFGLAGGTAITTVAATLGAAALFMIARTAFGDVLRKRAGPFLGSIEKGFREDALSYMLTMRFLPAMPFPVANIAPALLGAKLRDFVATTAVGIVPGVLAYTWIGAGLGAAFDAGETPDLASFARQLLPAFFALALVSLAPVAVKRLRRCRETA